MLSFLPLRNYKISVSLFEIWINFGKISTYGFLTSTATLAFLLSFLFNTSPEEIYEGYSRINLRLPFHRKLLATLARRFANRNLYNMRDVQTLRGYKGSYIRLWRFCVIAVCYRAFNCFSRQLQVSICHPFFGMQKGTVRLKFTANCVMCMATELWAMDPCENGAESLRSL